MLDGHPADTAMRAAAPARAAFGREGAFALGLAIETLLILSVSVLTGSLYHLWIYGDIGPASQFISLGLMVAVMFETPLIVRAHYRFERSLPGRRGEIPVLNAWTYAVLCMTFFAFMTKSSELISRGWMLLFFVVGLITVLGFEIALRISLSKAGSLGLAVQRNVALIGSAADISRFVAEQSGPSRGLHVVTTVNLPAPPGYPEIDPARQDRLLEPVAAAIRAGRVSDVVILSDWAKSPAAMGIAETFLDLPAAVHLGQIGAVERFPKMRVAQLGSTRTLVLRAEPLTVMQGAVKRIVDIVGSLVALVLFAPVFLLVALLIKLDSRGPVFFRQRRRGFNQREFRIWKFRTMTTLDDGDRIVQATENDPRVTRLGAFLRRYNIDELPQFINVLTGDMSLVGPRPHAVAHDRHYERIIARYGRRLNVKPGITGWAQINGYRGATEDDEAMAQRVKHDIDYIENWSIALDLYILLMTVLSPKAYKNAL